MASILTGGPASPGVNLYSLLFGSTLNPGPTAGTGTSYTFGLPGSLFMTVTGAGFTYEPRHARRWHGRDLHLQEQRRRGARPLGS